MRSYKNLRQGNAVRTFQTTKAQAEELLNAETLKEYNTAKAAVPDWLTKIIPFYGQRLTKEQLAQQREIDKMVDKELDALIAAAQNVFTYLEDSIAVYSSAWAIGQRIKTTMDNIPNIAPNVWNNYPGLQDFVKKAFPGGFYRVFQRENNVQKDVKNLEDLLTRFANAMAEAREWQPTDIYKSFKTLKDLEPLSVESDEEVLTPTVASVYRRRTSGKSYGDLARRSMRKALMRRKLVKR